MTGSSPPRLVSTVSERRWAAAPAAAKSARPTVSAAASGSTYGFSNRPSTNFSRSSRATDASIRDSAIRPERTRSTITSGHCSPPNWSAPASSARAARSATVRCSRPQARAGWTSPKIEASLSSPQSVQTIPSKPSSSRSRPVTTPLLKPKPTSSQSVPIGWP